MWVPYLTDRPGARYAALAEAIAEGARSGELPPGTRLPPQRALAAALGVNLTTVTRAYALAAEMGVVSGEVGRGTFIRLLPDAGRMPWPAGSQGAIDLCSNFPPPTAGAVELAQALGSLKGSAASDLLRYQPGGAHPAHLAAGAAWLAKLGVEAPAERLLMTSGAVHGVFLSLLALCRPGDRVLTEELASPAVIGACNSLGLRAEGLAMDQDGVRPDALKQALGRGGARALVLVPNLQNPTLAIMSTMRRFELVEVLRNRETMIVEDDAYGALLSTADRPPPLAALAPDRTCYATSLSKAVAPGLRVGFLAVPPPLRAATLGALRVSTWMTSPLLGHVATRWIKDGTAERLAARQREAARHRQELARRILGPFAGRGHPGALHIWLRLPEPWRAEEFAAYVQERGVTVLPAGSMAVETGLRPAAVRVSLCNESEERVVAGLEVLSGVLAGRL